MPQHEQVACFGKQNSYCDMRRTEAAEHLHGKWLCKAHGNTNNNNKKTGLVNSWITIEAHSTSIIRRGPSGWGFGSFPYIPLQHAVSWRLERLFMLSVRVLSTTKVVRMTHQTRKKDYVYLCLHRQGHHPTWLTCHLAFKCFALLHFCSTLLRCYRWDFALKILPQWTARRRVDTMSQNPTISQYSVS